MQPTTKSVTVIDPVCGMTVDPSTAKYSQAHAGQTYYFCSAGCREKFIADPGRWLAMRTAQPATPSAADVEYTCPMHPQIVQIGPGSCPICGMALEPRIISATDGENPELREMTRRFWLAVALTAPVLLLA